MVEPLPIVLFPDPGLRRPTRPAEVRDGALDPSVRGMAERMIETMHSLRGLGIAAPQVGWDRRVCIVSGTGDRGDELVLVNPRIARVEGEAVMEEGCLSFPGVAAAIVRAADVEVEALDLEGQPFRLAASGLLGRCILHEVDHLDGVLFTTRFTPADRIRNKRALRELEEKFASSPPRRGAVAGRR